METSIWLWRCSNSNLPWLWLRKRNSDLAIHDQGLSWCSGLPANIFPWCIRLWVSNTRSSTEGSCDSPWDTSNNILSSAKTFDTLDWCHMSFIASLMNIHWTVCPATCSGWKRKKQRSFPLLALCEGIHWLLVHYRHRGPDMLLALTCHDVIKPMKKQIIMEKTSKKKCLTKFSHSKMFWHFICCLMIGHDSNFLKAFMLTSCDKLGHFSPHNNPVDDMGKIVAWLDH